MCVGGGGCCMSCHCWARSEAGLSKVGLSKVGMALTLPRLWLRTKWASHLPSVLIVSLFPPPCSSAVCLHVRCHQRVTAYASAPPLLFDPPLLPSPFVQFVYTSAVISESLRMHPPAHVTTRLSHEPMTVGKHKLPPGRGGGRRQGGGGGGGAAGQAQAAPR